MTIMIFLPLLGILGSIASAIILLILIAFVVGIIFLFGRIIAGLVVNSVLGLIALYAVNAIFGIGVAISLLTLIIVAIFGLPAVLVIIILKLIGIANL